ncbi:MAG: VOC family protein [Actinobacteria bacterium]|nr:VOC family protein [Actinomycetota bacterium]
MTTYRFDHAVSAVRDLDVAAARWEDRYGLVSVAGGRHGRWGTANRIVPLGQDYLELLAVVEPAVAAGSVLGRRLLDLTAHGDRWFSVCLADDDIDATAARLGLTVEPGSRTTPEGVGLRWRGAGIDAEERELWLPFFIAWDVPAELHPGRTVVTHHVQVEGIAEAEISGDATRLREWLGDADVPLRVTAGSNGVRSVSLRRPGGPPLVVR